MNNDSITIESSAKSFASAAYASALSLGNGAFMAKSEDAEALAREAITLAETQFGAEHANAVTPLSNLATIYQAQGKFAAAAPLFPARTSPGARM